MKDFTSLANMNMILVYNHNGYLFKLPVSLGSMKDDPENDNASFWMSIGIAVVSNALFYAGYRLYKKKKSKTQNREHKIGFARYLSNTDRANAYLVENQIFY